MSNTENWLEPALELQELDLKIDRLNKQIDDIPSEIDKSMTFLGRYKENFKKHKNAKLELEKQVNTIKMDVDKWNSEIDKIQTQLLSTKDNDTYRKMMDEIEKLKGQVSDKETEELELFDQIDEKQALEDEAREDFNIAQKKVVATIDDLEKRMEACKKQIAILQEERPSKLAACPEEYASLYDRLRKKKTLALAELHEDQCGACHLKLTEQDAINAKKRVMLAQCSNCSALIYK